MHCKIFPLEKFAEKSVIIMASSCSNVLSTRALTSSYLDSGMANQLQSQRILTNGELCPSIDADPRDMYGRPISIHSGRFISADCPMSRHNWKNYRDQIRDSFAAPYYVIAAQNATKSNDPLRRHEMPKNLYGESNSGFYRKINHHVQGCCCGDCYTPSYAPTLTSGPDLMRRNIA